jgi:hypothetical protein
MNLPGRLPLLSQPRMVVASWRVYSVGLAAIKFTAPSRLASGLHRSLLWHI